MNISRRFSQADVSGVFGLLAFLADKDACAARLAELQAMVDTAAAEIAKASEASSAAAQLQVKAAGLYDDAMNVKVSLDRKLADVEARQDAAEKRVAEAEAKSVARGNELAAWANDLDQREKNFDERAAALGAFEMKLTSAEAQVTAMRADYEDKLAKFKALAS